MRPTTPASVRIAALTALALTMTPGCTPDSNPPAPVIRGFADYHVHQFAHLANAGGILTSTPTSASCLPPPPPVGGDMEMSMREITRATILGEARAQAASGKCYPTFSNFGGQQVSKDHLKRAWQGGMRLMVMMAVNSNYLCEVFHGPGSVYFCGDPKILDKQIAAALAFEAAIDAESGGSGKGWYRIVRTPDEARAAMKAGKLAVVLGIEASNAFGCHLVFSRTVAGVPIPPLLTAGKDERVPTLSCSESGDSLPRGEQHQRALALLEHYWQLGVRHFFPIHNVDGLTGGAALFNPVLHALDNPSGRHPGIGAANLVPAINRTIIDTRVQPGYQRKSCAGFDFDGGQCNAVGLTDTGFSLVRLMADYGAVIDIDHASNRAKADMLSAAGVGPYPFVSSHTGIEDIQHGVASNEAQIVPTLLEAIVTRGGAIAPILRPASTLAELDTYPPGASVAPHLCGGTSDSFVQVYRYLNDKMSKLKRSDGADAFRGIGMGSDFNGFAPWPAPRFATPAGQEDPQPPDPGFFQRVIEPAFVGPPITPSPGRCFTANDTTQPRVAYSDGSAASGLTMSTFPGRARGYDISIDGVAHIGMLPDFLAELKVLGLTDQELEPLWNGAEAYVRSWERTRLFSSGLGGYSSETGKGLRDQCSSIRSRLLSWPTNSSFHGPEKALFYPATLQFVDVDGMRQLWSTALDELKQKGCHGT